MSAVTLSEAKADARRGLGWGGASPRPKFNLLNGGTVRAPSHPRPEEMRLAIRRRSRLSLYRVLPAASISTNRYL